MADRDLGARLPQIELADLRRPIDGALKRPGRGEQRADLAQVVIDDRLAPVEPQRRDQLTDPLPGHRRVLAQQPMDLRLKRVELRARRRTSIDRRLLRTQRAAHRVAIDPEPPSQLLDRHPAHEVLAPQLGPPLHVEHPFLPASIPLTEPGSAPHPTDQGGENSTGDRG
jgi:hypothetical protein